MRLSSLLPSPKTQSFAAAILAGVFLALSWLLPGSIQSVFSGWITCFLFCWCLNTSEGRLLPFYLTGVIAHSLAFYWLVHTIHYFGMFPLWIAVIIFLLFVKISSLQFALAAFLHRSISNSSSPACKALAGVAVTLSWISTETLIFRLFPWQLGHSQAKFIPFIQTADIGGVTLISFFLLLIPELLVNSIRHKTYRGFILAPLIFILILSYGNRQAAKYGTPPEAAEIHRFALIQGNVSLEDKHDARYFSTNRERYNEMSSSVSDGSTVVIWPESVVQEWIPADIENALYAPEKIPVLPNNTPLIFGSLSFEKKTLPVAANEEAFNRSIERYNSAVAVLPDGTVPRPYNKRILMPFGEYTPLATWLPFLKEINSTAAEFSAGKQVEVFKIPLIKNNKIETINISPLICYEDIVPSLSRDSVNAGAGYLTSLSNDAWFGKTHAPYQHHLIALFRAVENRRFLFRSTNTGLTAVVSPTGETLLTVPTDSEQTLISHAWQLTDKTVYSLAGDLAWYVLSFLVVLLQLNLFTRRLSGRKAK